MAPSLDRSLYNGVAETFSYATHKYGCRKGGGNLKISANKVFFSVREVKNKFHHFFPLETLLENSTSGPPEKFLTTPMHMISM